MSSPRTQFYNSKKHKIMLKRLLLLLFLCSFLGNTNLFAQDAIPINPNFTSNLVIAATLNGNQVVPAVDNNISGIAGFFVNEKRDELVVNIYTSNDGGNLTEVLLKSGSPDQNGPTVLNLTEFIEGKKINTTVTRVTKELITSLILGNLYLEIKTDDFQGTAARGALKLEAARSYVGEVRPENVLGDGSDSPALGVISTHYTPFLQTLEVNFFGSDLSSPITGAFLKVGDATTEEGEIAFDLTEFVNENRIFAEIDATDFKSDLSRNDIHIVIQTEDYPEGEIRGQLLYTKHLVHDGWLSGDQVAPDPTNEGIKGFALFILKADFRSCDYWILTDGLEDEITQVKLHNADPGETSATIYNLNDAIDGKVAIGSIESESLTTLGGRMLEGIVYIRIATEDLPDGILRGQLYRIARDGHLYTFCRGQVSNDIDSEADGGGIISISRKLNYSHLLFTSHNLSSEVQSVTLNEGDFGEEGEEIVNLSFIAEASVVNWYWDGNFAASPFEPTVAEAIKASKAYFLYSTENYPEGEIRGQILSQLNCNNRFNESADLELELDVTRVHYAQYDTLGFCFTLTNNGFATANDVRVYVPLPDGFVYCYDITEDGEYNLYYSTWDVGILEPGQSAKLQVVNLAMSSGNNINYFAQLVNSSAYDHDSTPGNNQTITSIEDDEVSTSIIAIENGGSGIGDFDVDLELDLAADRMEAGPYENVNYTVTITNKGSDYANHVVTNVTIPPGLAYTSHSFSKGSVQLYRGQWYIQSLAPGESATLDLELFTLWPSSTIRYFVQVHSVDEPDKDSTPGNVYNFVVSEDDEARVDITTTSHTQQNIAPGTQDLSMLNKGEIYPNPARELINLMIQSGLDQEGEVIIYNSTGQIVLREKNTFNQGFNEFNYDVSDFPVGTYFIKIPEMEITSRFIKM